MFNLSPRRPIPTPSDYIRAKGSGDPFGAKINESQHKNFSSYRLARENVKPFVYGMCSRTAAIKALSYSGVAGDGQIVWVDGDDHTKTFDIDLRDGTLRYVQPVIDSLSYTVAPGGPTPIITTGILAYFIMYYKDGSEINSSAVIQTGNLFFSATAAGFSLVHQPLLDHGTQAWETAGHEAKTLSPSGFAIRVVANDASNFSINVTQLLVASLNQ